MPTAEGFYSFAENRYIYQYRDHLGNARVSFAKNSAEALEVTDTNNFYPFGLNHIGGNNNGQLGSYSNYKYNGKELQETGFYDYGARMYMADIGRWGVMDAMSEKYRRHSPYNYAVNNPIMFTDPDGNDVQTFSGAAAQQAFINYRDSMSNTESSGNNYFSNFNFDRFGDGNPKPNFWERVGNFFGSIFNTNEKAGISTFLPGAAISRAGVGVLDVGWVIPDGVATIEGIGLTATGTAAATLGLVLMPTMINEPAFDWTRGINLDIPADKTKPQFEFFYRAMSTNEYLSTGGFLQQKRDQNGNYRGEGPFVTDRLEYAERALNGFSKKDKYNMIVQYTTQPGTTSLLNSISLPHGPGMTGAYSERLGLPIKKIELGGTNYGFYGSNVNIFNIRLVAPSTPIKYK